MKVTSHICDYANCRKEIIGTRHNGPSSGYAHEPSLEFCSETCAVTYYQLAAICIRRDQEKRMHPKNWVGMN